MLCRRNWFTPVSKVALRKSFRLARQQITKKDRLAAAFAAANLFVAQDFFEKSQHIACYLACQDEFDASPLIEAVWAAKKQCYVPVIHEEKWLRFIPYEYGTALKKNQFGILEPAEQDQSILPADLDVVVLPLIAFDRYGHRLGTGGGYYDRTFAFLRGEENPQPCLVGLAYAAQETAEIEADPWDVPLNFVMTEKNVIAIA